MIAFMEDENLRLVLEAPKGRGMDDTVAIAPEIIARRVRGLGVQPPAALPRM
jgi:hypothetical protein